ncbi:MAG: hypothetical protein IPL65_18655 [Lewinellaceae bacterium]|nr:hypothetical protein [Lewinellaceae bacterium]
MPLIQGPKTPEIGEETATLIYTNPKSELRILAHRAEGTHLVSPLSGAMTGKISESLQARLHVELTVNVSSKEPAGMPAWKLPGKRGCWFR